MADPKQEKRETTKQAPKVDKKGDLSEKDWEKAAGGSFSIGRGDQATES